MYVYIFFCKLIKCVTVNKLDVWEVEMFLHDMNQLKKVAGYSLSDVHFSPACK